MKHAVIAATLLLVGGTAVACGGDDGAPAPSAASEKDFCASYNSLFEDAESLGGASDEKVVAEIKAWGRQIEETGAPESMPAEARSGLDETVALLSGIADDAGQEEFQQLGKDVSAEARQAMEAFDSYSMETCGSPLDELKPPSPDSQQ